MSNEISLMSSINWLFMPEYQNIIILDWDGWDRSSREAFQSSVEELIPRDEFERRLNLSTQYRYKAGKKGA